MSVGAYFFHVTHINSVGTLSVFGVEGGHNADLKQKAGTRHWTLVLSFDVR